MPASQQIFRARVAFLRATLGVRRLPGSTG